MTTAKKPTISIFATRLTHVTASGGELDAGEAIDVRLEYPKSSSIWNKAFVLPILDTGEAPSELSKWSDADIVRYVSESGEELSNLIQFGRENGVEIRIGGAPISWDDLVSQDDDTARRP